MEEWRIRPPHISGRAWIALLTGCFFGEVMMKRYALCSILALLITTAASAAITGSIIPNSIAPVPGSGDTQAYAVEYTANVTSGSAKADVLFLTDSTGSMGAYISGLRATLDDIISGIDASLGDADIKYGIADYKDYRDWGNYTNYGVNLRQAFTDDTAAVKSAINSMYAVGGYDLPESQLKALVNLAGNWLSPSGDLGFSGRSDAQKIVVWAGDVEGHYFGEGGDGPPDYYPSLNETLAALNAKGIVTFGLNLGGSGEGLDRNYGGDNQATYLTSGTGGKLLNNLNLSTGEIQAAIVDAVMTGVEVLTNITLALECDGDLLLQPVAQTLIGSWTAEDGDISGYLTFELVCPQGDDAYFDMVLLGNGAELDRITVDMKTVPEPATCILLGLGSLTLLRKRRS